MKKKAKLEITEVTMSPEVVANGVCGPHTRGCTPDDPGLCNPEGPCNPN